MSEERTCALSGCGKKFLPNAHNQTFCCDQHKVAAENRRNYLRHQERRRLEARARKWKRQLPEWLTLAHVGRALWLQPSTMHNYVHGRTPPRLEAEKRLCSKDHIVKWHVRRDDLYRWLKAKGKLALLKRFIEGADNE